MKRPIFSLFFSFILYVSQGAFAQQLQTVYDTAICGLGYKKASTLITQRMSGFTGSGQPAQLAISGIPASSKIERAFIWWDIAGNKAIQNDIIVKNPNNITDTFPSVVTGGGNNMCWGKGYAFRADVTSHITGNGNYFVSGFPSDTTHDFNNFSDANGATLLIVYSDPFDTIIGGIKINDGYIKAANDTISETMSNINVLTESNPCFGNAFMIVSDLQGATGSSLQMNTGPFLAYPANFWDYEERSTVFLPTQHTAVFGVRAPNDCAHLIMTGVYFYENSAPLFPQVTPQNDTLTSTLGSAYQWYLNNIPIDSATGQTYIVDTTGVYHVVVSNPFGCGYLSDTLTVVTCKDRMGPNINFIGDSLWTDSVNYVLQWFFNDTLLAGATDSVYKATATGYYWVHAYDSITKCSAYSDSVYISFAGINDPSELISISIYPNPSNGKFSLEIRSADLQNAAVSMMDLQGQIIFSEQISSTTKYIKQLDLTNISAGIYFLQISSQNSCSTQKVIITCK